MIDYLIPLLLAVCAVISLRKQENVYDHLLNGAADGLNTMMKIAPSLIVLMSSLSMFRASGALEFFENLLNPILQSIGIPAETIILILIRPISGSAALAVGTQLIITHGPDSLIGRTVAVMLGSTETTFYIISVYFGSCGIKKTKYTVPAALIADITGFLAAAWTVRLLMQK